MRGISLPLKMRRYIHIMLSLCVALIISLAGLVELEHPMCTYHSPLCYSNFTDCEIIEECSFENEIAGSLTSATRLRGNTCPVRHITSRTPLRIQNQQRAIKYTTFKLGKTIDSRTVIAHYILKGLLPMATKSKNQFIIRIHKLSIEP